MVSHEALLDSLLDVLIPPDAERGLPGAGSLGLAPELLAVTDIVPVIEGALEFLGEDFPGSSEEARHEAVASLAAEQPIALPGILFQLYQRYYAHPRVLDAIGMPPRPPYPEGYEMEPSDFTGLDRVRAREKLYRDA